MNESDYPHITVAAVAEHKGNFLFVREQDESGGIVLNQPAGHLEPGETLIEAVVRESMEETAWEVEPLSFLGVSQYTSPTNGVSYVRHTFAVKPVQEHRDVELDDGILEAVWLSPEDAFKMQLRSPLVEHSVEAYLSGMHYPLTIYHHI